MTLLALAAPAASQPALAWKLAAGQSFEMDRTLSQDQLVEVRAKAFKQQTESRWRVHFEVLTAAPGEPARVRATLKEVLHKLKGNTGAGLDHTLADKLQGQVFIVNVDARGRIAALEGYDDFVTAASDKQPDRMRALRSLLPEIAVKEALADFFGPLPDQEVQPGSNWQRNLREPIPHFGALLSTWHFVADKPSPRGQPLAYTIQTTYQAPTADETPLFRIVKGSLHGENGRGQIIFDPERGRLVHHERRLTIRGTLTVDMMGMQAALEFASVHVLDIKSR